MNDYPFDEVAINDTARLYSGGAAPLSSAATGRAATVRQGLVTSAKMEMEVPPPRAVRRQNGLVDAQMDGWAQAIGKIGVSGVADALMQFEMIGMGQAFALVGSSATMLLDNPLARGGVLAFGGSQAELSLSVLALGEGHHGIHAGSRASLSMRADSVGSIYQRARSGGYALGWTYATGGARLIQFAGSLAEIDLEALAAANVGHIVKGQADAPLDFDIHAFADALRGVLAGGEAAFGLEVDTRDRRILTWPGTFYSAPRSRIIRVPAERRLIKIPRDYRAIKPRG